MTSFGGGWGQPDQRMLDKLNWLVSSLHGEVLKLKRRVYRTEAIAAMKEAGITPRMPMEFTSQFGEDLWLWELFDGKREGFFIEVGAYDGYSLSVTYPFEAAGWTGLLVEPIPDRFAEAKRRRPHSRVVNAALSVVGSEGETTFHVVPKIGTLSFLSPDPKHLAIVQRDAGQVVPIKVPVTTMSALLADHTGPIDFVVIDVEGSELSVLNGFDLERFRPRVLMIEDDFYQPQSRLTQYMKNFPYTEAGYVWINRVYIRNDETELLARAKSMVLV